MADSEPKVKAKDPGAARDELTQKAREAEQDRQKAVSDAVADAHDDELPKLGGPEANPGNPGHDPETGKPV